MIWGRDELRLGDRLQKLEFLCDRGVTRSDVELSGEQFGAFLHLAACFLEYAGEEFTHRNAEKRLIPTSGLQGRQSVEALVPRYLASVVSAKQKSDLILGETGPLASGTEVVGKLS